ncbi:MAG: hypothetical protein COV30_00865 [Candidatus Yanofskybacteria bacterium CG10_big_fil_rev_8_21_14_0_10_37_15]|uniref:Homing endonuclease LAGLIDADG domain-containing protein n=1 Tax=Candidatus Yanofskybacteria bacterium CG10_big_fil_rev_8_21_14_0_10_37_15 TaxID=1975097 RepID=A0A2H0R7H8_9BACT|nr:MAG: hypothetical protein COV30_00865 [Candidatus Yanofskybacteria bacterium CG10_big_fil_rev_8_21_14_0_10_37_15]
MKSITSQQQAYIAGFLDGDGSIYVQAKKNPTYRYGYQVAPYVVLFQSTKSEPNFMQICNLIGLGHLRRRKDGISEYIIGRINQVREFLKLVQPFVILKKRQVVLMLQILNQKDKIENREGFEALLKLIDAFREFNYSKKRLKRTLTP